MFGISLAEISIILIIAIILVPAKELPKIVRFCSRTYKKAQQMYVQLLRELNLMDQ
ncbi:MAG: hypothetical protein ACON35_01405 [Candidatus Marinamargulisbacteria bacterium]